MELIKLGERTYYINNSTNIGIYKIDNQQVYIIDTGMDTDCAKKIMKIIKREKWKVKAIINTHSHADHIGGNNYIQYCTNCEIYSYGIESAMTNYTIIEPSILYGGNPVKQVRNKFIEAIPSLSSDIGPLRLDGVQFYVLRGHSPRMIGILTSDNIFFIGDSVIDERVINKYGIFYLFNVKEFLYTLTYIEENDASLFVPSHFNPTKHIKKYVDMNRKKVYEIIDNILDSFDKRITFENLLKNMFKKYNLKMDDNQYYIISSTLKAYLTYLVDEGKLTIKYIGNKQYFVK